MLVSQLLSASNCYCSKLDMFQSRVGWTDPRTLQATSDALIGKPETLRICRCRCYVFRCRCEVVAIREGIGWLAAGDMSNSI